VEELRSVNTEIISKSWLYVILLPIAVFRPIVFFIGEGIPCVYSIFSACFPQDIDPISNEFRFLHGEISRDF
jgi:hypothetical protein